MKEYLFFALIFIVALVILWMVFPFYQKLSGLGVVELNHFLKRYITSPFLFSIIMKPYIYFSLTILGNIIPILVFVTVGTLASKFTEKFWLVAVCLLFLMLFNFGKLLFDSAVALGTDITFLNILTWLTSSFSFPLWGLLGYYFGQNYVVSQKTGSNVVH